MSEIISIEGNVVKIGNDDGKIVSVPIASLNFSNPKIGDKVKVFSDKSTTIVKKINDADSDIDTTKNDNDNTSVNKHIFVWVFNFLLGGFGVDRFVRGQVGAGVCKLLFGWLTIGIWPLVDWIISMVKAYGASFDKNENITFDSNGDYIR